MNSRISLRSPAVAGRMFSIARYLSDERPYLMGPHHNAGETPALPRILERRAPLLDRPLDENNQHTEGQQDQNDNRPTDSLHKRAVSSRGLTPDQIPGADDAPQEQR